MQIKPIARRIDLFSFTEYGFQMCRRLSAHRVLQVAFKFMNKLDFHNLKH